MIGLVLVTHGRLAEELRAAMEHVVGAQRNVATVCIGPDDDMEGRRAEIRRRIEEVNRADVEVLAGVNLPMLVKLAKVRSSRPLADTVDCAQMAGRKYIAAASQVLPHCRSLAGGLVANGVECLPPLAVVNGAKLNGTTG